MKCYKGKYHFFVLRKLFGKHFCISAILIILFLTSCEKWYETKDVSHVSQLPSFEISGGDFNSFIVVDSGKFTDPGAKAFEGENELAVYAFGEADLTKVGAYVIYYYSENSDGLAAIGQRIISVTHYDVSERDLSGKYEGTIYSPMTEMKVTKADEKGLYNCTEVFGFPGSEVKGRFVDLGENELILLPGDGDFGAYAMSEGTYTRSALSWTISLLDEPYSGLDIDVVWRKKD